MLNKILNIVFLIVVALSVFFYRDRISNVWAQSYSSFFPCQTSIAYSLGNFDTRFGISQKDFLDSLSQAEKVWETALGRDLFRYDPNGSLKINLVYDKRQATTEQMKKMGLIVSNTKSSYDSLKEKYNFLQTQYKKSKIDFDTKIAAYETKKIKYESEVSALNARGGADRATYIKLSGERDSINSDSAMLKKIQSDLNAQVDSINALASSLNEVAKSLNLTVDKINNIGESLGGEFEEGTYTQDATGRKIDIYQFDNKTKLIRVLSHEFGHALGLEHNNDPKAIMYRLNNGVNEKLTQTDIQEVKNLCGVK